MNGGDRSTFYHIDPSATTNTPVYKLDYPDGELYSLDTLRDSNTLPVAMYVAMGGNKIFCQDISNGVCVSGSCLDVTRLDMPLVPQPEYEKIYDPIDCFTDNRIYFFFNESAEFFNGTLECIVP